MLRQISLCQATADMRKEPPTGDFIENVIKVQSFFFFYSLFMFKHMKAREDADDSEDIPSSIPIRV
jgi:hypothetical protein